MNLTNDRLSFNSCNLPNAVMASHKLFLDMLRIVSLCGDMLATYAHVSFLNEKNSIGGILNCRSLAGELFEEEMKEVTDYVIKHEECKSVIFSCLNLDEEQGTLSAITVCFNGEVGHNLVVVTDIIPDEDESFSIGEQEGPFVYNFGQTLSLQLLEFWLNRHK